MTTDINPVVALLGLITALCTGGFFNLLLSTLSGRRGRKVDEVQEISKMQREMRDEIRAENKKLNDKLDGIEVAVNHLAKVFNEVFPRVEGLTVDERNALQSAMELVRIAV